MQRPVPPERLCLIGKHEGLTSAQADKLRQQYGDNNLLGARVAGWQQLLRDTLTDPMLWFLLVTALLFLLTGDRAEAVLLALAIVPIIGMDAFLHHRTSASTSGLASRLAASATVQRDGMLQEIAVRALVPGDLVLVSENEHFPADCVIVCGEQLQVDESALTGEAMPVRKAPTPASPDGAASTALSFDEHHWGLAGTRLLTGEAWAYVVFAGAETVYGQIAHAARVGRHTRTPLQQAMMQLVRALVVISTLVCIALALTRLWQGHGLMDALLSAVTLAVAALPEEFPVVFTFFLGVGVYRLAQRQSLVRRAVVVENIGRVTCICTDKTGTLTEGRLTLAHLVPAPAIDENTLRQCAASASRDTSGDPLDQAVRAQSGGIAGAIVEATFPFTEDRSREVAVVRRPGDERLAVMKGAPETVLRMCELDGSSRQAWRDRVEALARSGHKVIACARRVLDDLSWQGAEPDGGYELLGLLAFEDPLRDGVAEAVAQARAAGIRVVMITGDHPATAAAIATEAGIGAHPPGVIEGAELASRLALQDAHCLDGIDVIARAVPSLKLDIVRQLQAQGHIVAVTGDGVNDVPALQGADIGIAMGERGTRTAREVADIVLMDDNFRTIIHAIREGQQLFDNLKASFAYLLLVHIPLVTSAALIPFAGFPLLFLPVHIVWLELIIHPTALLVFQNMPTSASMESGQRHARFFGRTRTAVIVLTGVLITAAVIAGYLVALSADGQAEHARAMALVTLIAASLAVTGILSRWRTRASRVLAVMTTLSAVLLVQVPVLASSLHLAPLHLNDWLLAIIAGLVSALPCAFPGKPDGA